MILRNSKIFIDANAIAGAHQIGCWNGIVKAFRFETADICIKEATCRNRYGNRLVNREEDALKREIKCHQVSELEILRLESLLENAVDMHGGEKALLAYAIAQKETGWLLCGPDSATLRALQYLDVHHHICSMDKMCSLEALTKTAGLHLSFEANDYKLSEKWLQTKRTEFLLNPI